MKEAVKLPPRLAWIEHLKKSACNPVIRPQGAGPAADAIFNPAAIVHDGRVGLLCRAINFTRQPRDSTLSGRGAMTGSISSWTRNPLSIRGRIRLIRADSRIPGL